MELNELNKNAKGGTELMAERLYKYVDNNLLNQFQIIQSRVRDLDHSKKKIYWVHDLPLDPEVQHLKDGGWKKFDKIVFVSHWQQQMYNAYLGVPYSAGTVLRNAIDPLPFHKKDFSGPIRLIYFSTPHRGLNILYSVFDILSKEFDNIELDVYSSFELYGWPQRDEPYKELFKALNEHPKINYHKSVSNDEIRKAIMKSHIFAYPSTWQETSCLCLIEAMSGGLVSVHSSLAALPETSMGLTAMYGYSENFEQHAAMFYRHLHRVIMMVSDPDSRMKIDNNIFLAKQLADSTYGWETRAKEWEGLLRGLTK